MTTDNGNKEREIHRKNVFNEPIMPLDRVWCEEVIISTTLRRGNGKIDGEPIRIVTQVWRKDGALIAEMDYYQARLIKNQTT